MKTYLQGVFMVVVLAFSVTANAAFIGETVEATAFFPSLTVPTTIGGPVTSVVGAGIEFTDGQFGVFFGPSFDFEDTTITITHAATGHQPGTFNGYQFFDVLGSIDAIGGVSVLSDTTGFFSGDPSRVFFDTDHIFVNFQSLSFVGTNNPTIVLGVQFQSVPEPSTMLLLGSGLVGLVGYGRRRLKK